MLKSEFYYHLPEEQIAQSPAEPRDHSRLMALDRQTGEVQHKRFDDITGLLRAGDCLCINDTKVLPARLYGRRIAGTPDAAPCEFVLLSDKGGDVWECICRPGKKCRAGERFCFSERLSGEIAEVLPDGNRLIRFEYSGIFLEVLEEVGRLPLPPYITEKPADESRYQTVYAREPGSAAAPTAGLHFTPELLAKIEAMGVRTVRLTLHIGLGTFRPVKADDIADHVMHSEHYTVSAAAAETINDTRRKGGRIICVGTTSCRTIESAAAENGEIQAGSGDTSIFIYPGYKFKCMDGLITNFHLPESTLIMLVSAFAGYENTMSAYKTAVEDGYRFFSFGDAMAIL